MIVVILVLLVGLIVGISILVKKLNEGNETAEGIVGTLLFIIAAILFPHC